MFSRSNLAVTGGTFVQNQNQQIQRGSAFEKLQNAASPNAFHNSRARFQSSRYHSDAHIGVIDHLMEWIHGKETNSQILWLQGPMGSGKTPILQSIAERCYERGTLLASFFFSKFDYSRNHTSPLIATIAYQMSLAIPELRLKLESILENDPLIFEKSLEAQVQSLIVAPLMDLAASGFFDDRKVTPFLILLDGLDECMDARVPEGIILRVIARALRTYRPPLVFLIGSRPTEYITYTFESPELHGLWASIMLEDVLGLSPNVRKFLVDVLDRDHSQLGAFLTIPAAVILGTHWVLVKVVNEFRSG